MLHACYKSLHPPTAVKHAIKARLTSPHETNLIVVRANCMDVYTLQQQSHHLIHVRTFELFGNVVSVESVTFKGDELDSLLISYEEEAKVSVVAWDQEKNDLKTVSLHYFEDHYLREGRATFIFPYYIKLDPYRRCATLVIYDSKLVILPFRQQQSILDEAAFGRGDLDSMFSPTQKADVLTSTQQLKTSTLPVKRQIIIDLNEMGIRNIKDFCFLYGYYEPTILFLYEPEPTWSGRLAVKRNTCVVASISIDLSRESYPEVWKVTHLPHDCYKLIPLKESIGGGAIVLAKNSLLHVNHKAYYGLALNDFAQSDPQLAIDFDPAPVTMFLECTSYAFLAENRIILSTKGGELYILHLFAAGSSVRKMVLTKSKTSVPASCLCILSEHLLFLGSKLGDSLLIHYLEEKKKNEGENGDASVEPPRKKRKESKKATSSSELDKQSDEDFLMALDQDIQYENYDEETNEIEFEESEQDLVTYNLRVVDLFTNIGPIVSMAVVDTTLRVSTYSSTKTVNNNNLEVVLCSGYGKNGCLCLAQRNVRPEVLLEKDFEFDCKQIWTVKHNSGTTVSEFDAYLIFSADDGTKILQSKEALHEITRHEGVQFITNENTLKIGNALQSTRIIQICLKKVRYLDGITKLHDLEFEREIRSAAILGTYSLLHFKDGTMTILKASLNRLEIVKHIKMDDSKALKFGKITAATLFLNDSSHNAATFQMTGSEGSPEIFCAVVWSSGVFEIYNIPEYESVFTFLQFGDHFRTVFDQSASDTEDFATAGTHTKYPYVTEMIFRSLGNKQESTYLLISLSDGSILAYKAFCHKAKNTVERRLSNLRFTKVRNDYLIPRRDHTKQDVDESERLDLGNEENIFGHEGIRAPIFVPFDNIAGLGGVFSCGERPMWFLTERGDLRIHPMQHELCAVDYFTPFHNKGCKRGFVYFLRRLNRFKMAQLIDNPLMKYNTFWPTRKIPLLSTPHLIAYHQETQTCIVATSTLVRAQMVNGQEELPETGRYPPPMERQYTLHLFSSTTWTEMDKFEFEPHEHVLCVTQVYLAREEVNEEEDLGVDNELIDVREKDMIPYIAVGTGINEGEEVLCKGRIILFDLEPKLDATRNQYVLKVITAKELKGPAAQICQLEGYLSVCMGPKIYVYYFDWETKQLVVTSFYDTQFYIATLNTIKNFMLYGDMYKSVSFLRWKEKGHRLTLLARDFNECHIATSDFIVHGNVLGIVVSDMNKNIQIFTYSPPKDRKALLPCADFHTGAFIHSFIRLKSRVIEDYLGEEETKPRTDFKTDLSQQLLLFGNLDGGLGYFTPIDEKMYRRLYALTTKMYTQLEHTAGLHPKAYRLYKPIHSVEHNHQKNVIDGQLLWRFIHLDTKMQKALVDQSGTTVQLILESIKTLHQSTMYF